MSTSDPSVMRRLTVLIVRCVTWPIRRWRIVALLLVALVIAVTITYAIVDQTLLRQLEARREQIRASDGAKEFLQLLHEQPDIAENAAVPYRHAEAMLRRIRWDDREAIKRTWEKLSKLSPCSCEEGLGAGQAGAVLTEGQWNELGRHVDVSRPALEMVKEGAALQMCRFYGYFEPSDLNGHPKYSDMSLMEDLARAVAYRAVWENHNGDVDSALQWVTIGLHLSNDLAFEPGVGSGARRVKCAGHALWALQAVLCEHDAASGHLDQLTGELARATDRKLLVMTIQGSTYSWAYRESFSDWKEQKGGRGQLRPFWTSVQIKEIDVFTWFADAASKDDFEQRNSAYKKLEENVSRFSKRYLFTTILPTVEMQETVQKLEAGIAHAHLAEIAIALRLYKKDKGSYPDELLVLVPNYIKELPQDTFSGKSYPYKRVDPGFKMYSLGQDKTDDGGVSGDGRRGDIVWCAKN
ncbi:MAG: hypothetical protein HZB26_20720 [Candidatus Hydrogenedentes bacterium]|nr:hypothetical protein [Candidatus Hydrogenedentota bacterium]